MFLKSVENRNTRIVLAAASALALMSTQVPALALSLSNSKKSDAMQMPLNDKLDEATGSDTSTTNSASDGQGAAIDLSPLKLSDESASKTESKSDESQATDPKAIKLRADKSGFAAKSPIGGDENSVPETLSIKADGKGDKNSDAKGKNTPKTLSETAREVSAMPMALMSTEDETRKKVEMMAQGDSKQLADLWDACLNRNQDIQFVVAKLVPSSDRSHVATVMTRTLTGLLYGALGSMQMIAPSPGMYAGQQFALSAIQQIMGTVDSKQAKKMQLNQAELIMLYNMVRQTADKLSDAFRLYKDSSKDLNDSITSFEEIRNMIRDTNTPQAASSQLMVHIAVKTTESNISQKTSAVNRYRQTLVDLAGPEAVAKLDKQLQDEQHDLIDGAANGGNSAIAGENKPTL